MTEPTPVSDELNRSARAIEAAGKVAVAAVALLYCVGFFVVNLHLARFGLSALEILDRRYAFAGFWLFVPIALSALSEDVVRTAMRLRRDATSHIPSRPIRWAFSMLFISLAWWSVRLNLQSVMGTVMTWHWLVFIYGFSFIWVFAGSDARKVFDPTATAATVEASTLVEKIGLAVRRTSWTSWLFIVPYVVLFSHLLYPEIPAAWGGGGFKRVRLIPEPGREDLFRAVGVPITNRGTSAPVLLVTDTNEDYFFLLDSTRVVAVRRSDVAGVANDFAAPAARGVPEKQAADSAVHGPPPL